MITRVDSNTGLPTCTCASDNTFVGVGYKPMDGRNRKMPQVLFCKNKGWQRPANHTLPTPSSPPKSQTKPQHC